MSASFSSAGRRRIADQQRTAMRALLGAIEGRDDARVAGLLAPDVRLVVDAGASRGGTSIAESAPRVGGLLVRLRLAAGSTVVSEHAVNGGVGAVLRSGESVVAVVVIRATRRGVDRIWIVADPDKLRVWNAR